jgi:hypothetical protein
MRVRYIGRPEVTGWAGEFNTHGLGEVIVGFDEGDMTSEEVRLLEVQLEHPLESSVYKPGAWVPLSDAFRSRDLISDNFDYRFFEPKTEADKERGWA